MDKNSYQSYNPQMSYSLPVQKFRKKNLAIDRVKSSIEVAYGVSS